MRTARIFLILLICIIFIAPKQGIAAITASGCSSGEIIGSPQMGQVPTYDYAADGLLQFHFRFSQGEWNYNTLKLGLYDENCVLQSEPGYGQVGGVYLPPEKNILVKVEDSEPGKYNFKVYDEDSGEFKGTGLGFVPNDFNSSMISLTLTNVSGSYNAPIVDTITTATAPLRRTNPVPQREPVLIVPGVMGTELFKGEEWLWPNLTKMLTDINDNFLDDLAFNSDLTPASSLITAGNLVKKPFPGEHYYDSLIESLKQNGYTENQDLFVFPYDWRHGISERTVSDLADMIENLAAGNKINVIAHSTGGLLLKKAIQERGAAHVDKAIMVGVPNYGAAKAAKVLLYGDNMGIPWLESEEIKKIGLNMPVMYDLLPTPQYNSAYGAYFQQLVPGFLSAKLNKLEFQATTDHLTNDYGLNWLAFRNAASLHTYGFDNLNLAAAGVKVYTLAGCGVPTLSAVTEIKYPFSSEFSPLPVQPAIVSGDGTVGLRSAIGNNPEEQIFYLLYPDHGKLPGHTGALEAINGILRDNVPQKFASSLVTRDESRCNLKGKIVSIFGDIDVKVKTAAGIPVYPDVTLGNASDIQLIHQLSYNTLHLPEYILGGSVEIKSLSDNNFINIRIDDAQAIAFNAPPEKVFPDISLSKDSTMTLSGLGSGDPVVNVPVFEAPPIPPAGPEGTPSTETDQTGVGAEDGSSEKDSNHVSGSRASTSSSLKFPEYDMLLHPENTLVKFGPTIYLIEKGQRRGFRTYAEFLSYGYNLEQVVEGNVLDWNLPEGLIMLAKPNILARDEFSPNKLYYLNETLEKQLINAKDAIQRWVDKLGQIFEINLTGYREGLTIKN